MTSCYRVACMAKKLVVGNTHLPPNFPLPQPTNQEAPVPPLDLPAHRPPESAPPTRRQRQTQRFRTPATTTTLRSIHDPSPPPTQSATATRRKTTD